MKPQASVSDNAVAPRETSSPPQRNGPGEQAASPAVVAAASLHEGPLPSAAELQRYDQVVPGLAERIVRSWEKETEHRRSLERSWHEAEYRLASRGQSLAAGLSVLILGGSMFLVAQGHGVAGMAVVIAEIAALCGVFIYGRRSQTTGEDAATEPVESS